MITFMFGLFLILHGLVHMLYLGQSRKVFEMAQGLHWPDSAWAFSRMVGNDKTRELAALFLLIAAVGFAAGGLGTMLHQFWWRPLVMGTAVFSSLLFVLFWDGTSQRLADQGGVGLLINLAILLLLIGMPRLI